MEKILRTSVSEDPNIGLYGFATDRYCLVGGRFKEESSIHKILGVKMVKATVMDMDLVGMFCAGNSSGIIINEIAERHETDKMRQEFDNVCVIKDSHTALGNIIAMNDSGVILSPLLKRHKAHIEKHFGLECEVMTVAKSNMVGSIILATNRGCVVHPKTKSDDIKKLEKALNVEIDIGTVSFGSPFVKSGVIANSFGFLTSEFTSGPELGRITEALGFL